MSKFSVCFFAMLFVALGSRAQFQKAEVQVGGITCSMCQLATQKALKTIDFVSDIKADLNKNVFVLNLKPGKLVNPATIRKKIEDAGFSVNKLVLHYNFKRVNTASASSFEQDGNNYQFINAGNRLLDGDVKLMLVGAGFTPAAEMRKYAIKLPGVRESAKTFYVTVLN